MVAVTERLGTGFIPGKFQAAGPRERKKVAGGPRPADSPREVANDPKTYSPAAGRWFLVGLGLSIACAGGLFFWLMWRSYERAREMHSWPEVPCVILESTVEERRIDPNSPAEYRLDITYGYEFGGAARTGDHLTWRGNPWTSKQDVIEERSEAFREGARITCRVNPKDPDFSVLRPDSKAAGYSIWFPALFIVGGLGISVKAIASRRGPRVS